MQKIKSNVKKNIDKLEKAFPDCVITITDTDGRPCKQVDFELLHQMLEDPALPQTQKCEFTWAGRKEAAAQPAGRT